MQKLLFASNNQGKLNEVRQILTSHDILSPSDMGIPDDFDVAETGTTFEENSLIKAKAYGNRSGFLTIADDSGLEVAALAGKPGVYSKRYGDNDQHRNQKLLEELKDVPENQRTARFVSAMTLYNPIQKKYQTVRGSVEGKIATEARGESGFGYDPIFIADELSPITFAQAGTDEKNRVSHRARALEKIRLLL